MLTRLRTADDVYAASEHCAASRCAPAYYMPLLGPMLTAASPEVLGDPALLPALRNRFGGVATPAVAAALVALGVARSEVTEPVVAWLSSALAEPEEIERVCRDVLDPAALQRLREPAERDERVVRGGELSAVVWRDEAHRDALLAALG